MSRSLRIVLTLLVLTNLLFVQATEAASSTWLVPMYALTIVSLGMRRLRESAVYRAGWNLVVLGLFALLVQHTTNVGAAFLLEDGLRLAAICQVHLLNNLGGRQKPDLLFFNSFLIALVTSFLTQDVLYSAIFMIYAPLFVVGLAIHAVSRRPGVADVPAAEIAMVGRDALKRAGLVIAVTFALFVIVPRDFERRGFLGENLDLQRGSALRVDFNPSVELDRAGSARASDRLVMRVEIEEGVAGDVPSHWRGATMARFDGRRWRPNRRAGLREDAWRTRGGRIWTRDNTTPGTRLRVEMTDDRSGRLFVPLSASRVETAESMHGSRVQPLPDRSVVLDNIAPLGGDLRFALELDSTRRVTGGGIASGAAEWELSAYCETIPGTTPDTLRRNADRIASQFPDDVPQASLVEALRQSLASRDDYLPPGSPDGGTFASFASGETGGHCEYFATALALMLRHRNVPCRMVSGYLSSEWDDSRRTLSIRERHAHAWVEVFDGEAGWYTVDATPSAGDGVGADGASLVAMVKEFFHSAWVRIVDFDQSSLAGMWTVIKGLPGRLARAVRAHPFAAAGIVLLVFGVFVWLPLRRRERPPIAVRGYLAAVRAIGLELLPAETPREVLARARDDLETIDDAALEELEEAVGAHEAARYAAATP